MHILINRTLHSIKILCLTHILMPNCFLLDIYLYIYFFLIKKLTYTSLPCYFFILFIFEKFFFFFKSHLKGLKTFYSSFVHQKKTFRFLLRQILQETRYIERNTIEEWFSCYQLWYE